MANYINIPQFLENTPDRNNWIARCEDIFFGDRTPARKKKTLRAAKQKNALTVTPRTGISNRFPRSESRPCPLANRAELQSWAQNVRDITLFYGRIYTNLLFMLFGVFGRFPSLFAFVCVCPVLPYATRLLLGSA